MERKNLAVTGVFTLAAAGLVAVGIAMSSGSPVEQPDTVPAGQVEQVDETSVPSSTVPTVPPVADAPEAVIPGPADDGDTGPVNTPVPADQLPDIAPGNPAGDNEQRPDPAPAPGPDPGRDQPTDAPSDANQPPALGAPPAAG